MKVKVDKDSCLGCGICPDMCPEVLEMQDDGKAVAKVDQVPAEAEDRCREAAEQCPGEAIKTENEQPS